MYLPMHQAGTARVARTPLGPPLRALGQPSRARARARHVELAHIHGRAPRPIDALRTRVHYPGALRAGLFKAHVTAGPLVGSVVGQK